MTVAILVVVVLTLKMGNKACAGSKRRRSEVCK